MYYVYHGYVSPDNYDCSEGPTYTIAHFGQAQSVIDFKKEFDEGIHDECSNVIFRVFEGEEKTLVPIETVTNYGLI